MNRRLQYLSSKNRWLAVAQVFEDSRFVRKTEQGSDLKIRMRMWVSER